jgi:beta-glucanase (GH16 family)
MKTNKIYGTMHWGANTNSHASKGSSYTLPAGSFDQQFHVYSIIWQQDSIKVLVDDIQYLQFAKSDVGGVAYPFNADFFFIFNIAVGGNWPVHPMLSLLSPTNGGGLCLGYFNKQRET